MPASSGYISPDEIIADATSMCDDEGFKRFSYGSYLSQVQQALTELAFDTFFDERVFHGPVPANLEVPVDGTVNIEKIFLYNGECTPGNIHPVLFGRGFTRMKGATFKEQAGSGNVSPVHDDVLSDTNGILYYNTIGPVILLSDACGAFQNIMVRYRGLGCKLGDAPVVPNELRQAVKDYVVVAQLTKMFARDPQRWAAVLNNAKSDKMGGRGMQDVGSWWKARRRVQMTNIKEREDVSKYLTKMNGPKY